MCIYILEHIIPYFQLLRISTCSFVTIEMLGPVPYHCHTTATTTNVLGNNADKHPPIKQTHVLKFD